MRPKIFNSLLFCLLAVAQAKRDYDQDTSEHTDELANELGGKEDNGRINDVKLSNKIKGKLGVSGLSASNEDNKSDKKKEELGVSGLSASNEDNKSDKKNEELGVSGLSESNEENQAEVSEEKKEELGVSLIFDVENKKGLVSDEERKLSDSDLSVSDEANNQEKNAAFLTLTEDQIKKFNIWPEAKIPFYIDEFSYDNVLRDRIRSYLDDVSALTEVLDFEELPNALEDKNERWVLFVNRRGQLDCMDYTSNSFTNSGVQKVVIGYDCLNNRGDMAAMVLALAGVPPQHNAPNRDKYITVKDDNILPDKRQLFKRLSDGDWLFGTDYDPLSAGHYHSLKYTANGQPTIQRTVGPKVARTNGKPLESGLISENNNFSSKDIEKIRALYYKIMRNNPLRGIQKEQCDTLYEPGSIHPKLGSKTYVMNKNKKKVSPEPLSSLSEPSSLAD